LKKHGAFSPRCNQGAALKGTAKRRKGGFQNVGWKSWDGKLTFMHGGRGDHKKEGNGPVRGTKKEKVLRPELP